MTTCCFFLSLKTGCLIAVPIYFGFGIIKAVLLATIPIPEEPQAVVTLNIIILIISGILLLVGVLKEDRICIITFLCFNIFGLIVQSVGILVQYFAVLNEKIECWVIVIILIENVIFIYMIPIGIFEFRQVKEKHLRRVESYAHSSMHTHSKMGYGIQHSAASVPGLGV